MVFLSMHGTHDFGDYDFIVSLMARCFKDRPEMNCAHGFDRNWCVWRSTSELRLRLQPHVYGAKLCCCLGKRMDQKVFWGGTWYSDPSLVPLRNGNMPRDRTCKMP